MKNRIKKKNFKGSFLMTGLMTVTFFGITLCYITYPSIFLRVLPLYISLVVMFMQSFANRYALLLGALNSVLYAVAYYIIELPQTALYALLVSFPLQLISFINWSRKKYGRSTVFRRLSGKALALLSIISISSWLILYFIFSLLHSPYLILDNTITIIGIIVSILTLLSYIDAVYFQILSCAITIVLYIRMTTDDPSKSPFLVYSIYSFICILRYMHSMNTLYKKQREAGITYKTKKLLHR